MSGQHKDVDDALRDAIAQTVYPHYFLYKQMEPELRRLRRKQLVREAGMLVAVVISPLVTFLLFVMLFIHLG